MTSFVHFGIQTSNTDKAIIQCQKAYLLNLKPVEVKRKKGDGRVADSDLNAAECSDFRSLVSGIAWLAMTSPVAQAAASLYQHYLPVPHVKHALQLNEFLASLTQSYVPLRFEKSYNWDHCRFLVVTDSSLGNNDKYSQNGYTIFLNHSLPHVKGIGGACSLLAYKSARSKRVASSTMSAETLAGCAGTEECSFIQYWFHEIKVPTIGVKELLYMPCNVFMKQLPCVDCMDLYKMLIAPAQTLPSNKSLALYLSSLREDRHAERIASWVWVDTRDMLSNPLTKLESDGQIDWKLLRQVLLTNRWYPSYVYQIDGQAVCPPSATSKLHDPKYLKS
jgi:hypothetical protein